jgi:type II secretory pathway component PulK
MTHRDSRHPRARRGFLLLAVLWVLVGLAGLGLALNMAGRDAVATAQSRVSLARAHWLAEACVEMARAVGTEALAETGEAAWRGLDTVVASSPLLASTGCALDVRAAGTTLDVNGADAEQLRRLFVALGALPASADSLVDALLDWRDADHEVRPNGAERAWYEVQHRFLPRDGPIADGHELVRVRGLDSLEGIDSLLGVETGRVVLSRAPLPVIAALPGFSEDAVLRIGELRDQGPLPAELLTLAGSLSPSARDSLAARYAEVVPLVTIYPDAWIITADARDGDSPAVAFVEVRLARAGARIAILRHRTWP